MTIRYIFNNRLGDTIKRVAVTLAMAITVFCYGLIDSREAFADSFYPSGDSANCNFAVGQSISIKSLPQINFGSGALSFDTNQVSGEEADFPYNHTIHDIAETAYPNARRFLGVADRVAVPPKATVDVAFYPYNYTGHTVRISSGKIFVSGTNGDWTKIAENVVAPEQSVQFRVNGTNITKAGKAINIGNLGSFANRVNEKGRVLTSLTISEPISSSNPTVDYYHRSNGDLIAVISTVIKNISSSNVSDINVKFEGNILFSGGLSAGAERVITVEKTVGQNYITPLSLGFFTIQVNSSQTECVQLGSSSLLTTNPASRMFIFDRDDSGAPTAWTGKQVDFAPNPEGNAMCITRIPYSRNTENAVLEVKMEVKGELLLSDSDEIRVGSITAKPGERVKIDVRLENVGAKIDSLIWKLIDEESGEELDISNVCQQTLWLNYGATWVCGEYFVIPDEYANTKRVINLVVSFSGAEDSVLDQAFVDVGDTKINATIQKTSSKTSARIGELVDWEVMINAGEDFYGSVDDSCVGCELQSGLESVSTSLIPALQYIPTGVYGNTYRMEVVNNMTQYVENCAGLFGTRIGDGDISSVGSSCSRVLLLHSWLFPENVVHYLNDAFTQTTPTDEQTENTVQFDTTDVISERESNTNPECEGEYCDLLSESSENQSDSNQAAENDDISQGDNALTDNQNGGTTSDSNGNSYNVYASNDNSTVESMNQVENGAGIDFLDDQLNKVMISGNLAKTGFDDAVFLYLATIFLFATIVYGSYKKSKNNIEKKVMF